MKVIIDLNNGVPEKEGWYHILLRNEEISFGFWQSSPPRWLYPDKKDVLGWCKEDSISVVPTSFRDIVDRIKTNLEVDNGKFIGSITLPRKWEELYSGTIHGCIKRDSPIYGGILYTKIEASNDDAVIYFEIPGGLPKEYISDSMNKLVEDISGVISENELRRELLWYDSSIVAPDNRSLLILNSMCQTKIFQRGELINTYKSWEKAVEMEKIIKWSILDNFF